MANLCEGQEDSLKKSLENTIAKLDELIELIRDTKRALPPTESKQLMPELAEIRAHLLRDASLKRPNR